MGPTRPPPPAPRYSQLRWSQKHHLCPGCRTHKRFDNRTYGVCDGCVDQCQNPLHRGDRDLAAVLLYEHGICPAYAEKADPEIIEILACSGRLWWLDPRDMDRLFDGRLCRDGKFSWVNWPLIDQMFPKEVDTAS